RYGFWRIYVLLRREGWQVRRLPTSAGDPFRSDDCFDICHTFRLGDVVRPRIADATAEFIKTFVHSPNPLKQLGVHEGSNRIAILLDEDDLVLILYLVEHFAQILAEIDGTDFGAHVQLQSG
ncbi:MAG: hypothetical protein Q4E06_09520, partial [Lautropia sp.]|nr:hypothetical protein [Lautropia sp.]